jgi:hypothetical protein
MFLFSSADRFRFARPILFSAVLACAAPASHSAYGQFDPAKTLAPLKLELPTVDTEDAAALRLRGEALYRSDPTDAANLRNAFDCFQKSYRLADKNRDASGVNERFPPPEIQLCRPAVELGHREIATRYADDLRRELPKYAQANPAERLRCGLFLAEHFLVHGDGSAARKELEAGGFSADQLRRIVAIMHYFANDPTAIEELSRLFAEFPDDERISNYLARALADSEQPAERSRALRVAIANQAAHPSSLSARCTLAWAQLRSGDSHAAVEAVRPVLEEEKRAAADSRTRRDAPLLDRINPDDAYLLAKAVYEIDSMPNRTATVIALLQNALKNTGPFRYRRQAEEWLR